jgi:xanthine dehydrogenase large subunit
MLAISVFLAIRDAIAAAAPKGAKINLDAPATPERILMALDAARGEAE